MNEKTKVLEAKLRQVLYINTPAREGSAAAYLQSFIELDISERAMFPGLPTTLELMLRECEPKS